MKLSRRASARLLAGAVAASPSLIAQQPAPPARSSSDPLLQSARNELLDNAQRIARVKLPRPTEPAFRFRA